MNFIEKSLKLPFITGRKIKAMIEHREAVKEFGSCEYHQQTFQLLKPEQLSL